jgi:hypothetical protein
MGQGLEVEVALVVVEVCDGRHVDGSTSQAHSMFWEPAANCEDEGGESCHRVEDNGGFGHVEGLVRLVGRIGKYIKCYDCLDSLLGIVRLYKKREEATGGFG